MSTRVPAFLTARRSIRAFTNEPIDRDLLDALVEAACHAPAPHHSRPWRFVVLRDEPLRTRLLDAMRDASHGDDSRDGDETVMRLEALAAERTGKEAGAFMPSGTMTNLVAVLTHAQRGGECGDGLRPSWPSG